jgi:hypothetical protein
MENAMKILAFLLAAAATIGLTAPVFAQQGQDYCARRIEGNPPSSILDQGATDTFHSMVARQDNNAIVAMTGVWYAEIPAPQLGMTSYQYRQYQSNGLFQYQDQTCTNGTQSCSQNQGTGFFTAMTAQDGSFATMIIVSDLQRDHECSGGYMRMLDQNHMQDGGGTVWQRVQ